MPTHGEASNHSAVDFADPKPAHLGLFQHARRMAVVVQLAPGDGLFIPEGWWHQVDSAGACGWEGGAEEARGDAAAGWVCLPCALKPSRCWLAAADAGSAQARRQLVAAHGLPGGQDPPASWRQPSGSAPGCPCADSSSAPCPPCPCPAPAAELTTAVNFWWRSLLSAALQAAPHMQPYLRRQLLAATVEQEVEGLLGTVQPLQLASRAGAQQQGGQQQGGQQQRAQQQGGQQGEAWPACMARHETPAAAPGTAGAGDVAAQLSSEEEAGLQLLVLELSQDSSPREEAGAEQQAGVVASQAEYSSKKRRHALTAAAAATAAASAAADTKAGEDALPEVDPLAVPCLQPAVPPPAGRPGAPSSVLPGTPPEAWLDSMGGAHASARGCLFLQKLREGGGAGEHEHGLQSPVTRLLATLAPVPMSNMLFALAQQRPDLAEKLLTRGVPPAAARLLARMFDRLQGALAAAASSAEGGQGAEGSSPGGSAAGHLGSASLYSGLRQFFSVLYGACADPDAVLENLLSQGGRLSSVAEWYVLGYCK
jgi:hypothetical protein